MAQEDKTKEELIEEIKLLQKRIAELDTLYSERKRMDEAIKNSEAMFKGVVTAVPVGLGVASNRVIEWTNDYLLAIFGFQKEEVIGKNSRIFYESEEGYNGVGGQFYADLRAKGSAETETVWKHKNGKILNIYLTGVVLGREKIFPRIIFCALDITERKKLEEEKRKQLHELEVFYKASIGREERIIELKKEIKILKQEPRK